MWRRVLVIANVCIFHTSLAGSPDLDVSFDDASHREEPARAWTTVTKEEKGWPALKADVDRLRERTFHCEQREICTYGDDCYVECAYQEENSNCEEEPVIHFRLVGAATLDVEYFDSFSRRDSEGRCSTIYELTFTVLDEGEYHLLGTVMYETFALATQSPPKCSLPPIGTKFRAGPIALEPRPDGLIIPEPPQCTPEQISSHAGKGRWVKLDNGSQEWQPWACRLPKFDLNSVSGSLIIIGDSHQRKLASYISQVCKRMRIRYKEATGLYNQHIPGSLFVDDAYPNCKTEPFLGKERGGGVIEEFEKVCQRLSLQRKNHSGGRRNIPWVIVEAGHWDLRDGPVDLFIMRFRRLLASIKKCDTLHGRIIIRTAPSYSYQRVKWLGREYRTNTKLGLVAEFIKAEVAIRAPYAFILDSFAWTSPRFEDSCDFHHYLCESSATNGYVGVEKDSTVPALLGLMGL